MYDAAKLSVYNGESNNKSSIIVSHDAVNSAQKWYIYKTYKGYVLRPSHSDKVMDLDGGGYAAGTNIQIYEYNCTYAQYFDIIPTEYSINVIFNANAGTCSTQSKTLTFADIYGTLPTPTRTGYTFEGWYTEKTGGTKITSDTKVTITSNQTLYAHWSKNIYKVYFDGNGGASDTVYMSIFYDGTYDELANAERDGYKFLGWYTEKEGGTLVTNDTVYKLTTDQTLYAHWEKINIQGDINLDNTLTIADAVSLRQQLTKSKVLTENQLKAADINQDGKINVFDWIALKRLIISNK